jgi:predicted DNA-binding transcriptional regulator AlpA
MPGFCLQFMFVIYSKGTLLMIDDEARIPLDNRAAKACTDRDQRWNDAGLLSKKDISCLFQISERQVTNLMKSPGFPKRVKGLGRSVRFSASAVKEFVQNG